MLVTESKIKVRYVETDQMGIVHHSNYYPWFELARGDFIGQSGMTYKEIEEQGILFPLVESYCKYVYSAKYDDELTIKTFIKELNGVKAIFNYEVIRDEDQKLIAKGSTTHAFVNCDFKIVNIKKKYGELWETLSKCLE